MKKKRILRFSFREDLKKLYRIMRLTVFFSVLLVLHVMGFETYSQGTRLSMELKDATIEEVFEEIEKQSDFIFLYNYDAIFDQNQITAKFSEVTVEDILDNILDKKKVDYLIRDRQIIIKEKNAENSKSFFDGNGIQNEKRISGKVKAQNGEPIPGVSIIVKGTTIGTVTDVDGHFVLEIPTAGKILQFSFVGMKAQDVTIGSNSVFEIILEEETIGVDEVVVVGYGSLKKSDLTGSVASIKADDIASNKAANVLQVLQGKVAGLDITQSSGQAGSNVNITLRGIRSITAGNNPLILVDGIEYGSMIDINSSDIESIEVLKDGASTAIYGTKGANGVILISTKRGGSNKTNVTFNSYTAINTPNYKPRIMKTSEFIQKRLETFIADEENKQYKNAGIAYNSTTGKVTWNESAYPNPTSVFGTVTNQDIINSYNIAHPADQISNPNYLITADPATRALIDANTSIDYLDMIFVNSTTQNYELGVTGGNEKTAINFSLGYLDDRGLLRSDEMNKYNLKVGLDHKVSNAVKIGANLLFTSKKYDRRNGGIFNQALKTGTIAELWTDETKTNYRPYPDLTFTYAQPNPLLDEVEGATVYETYSNRLFGASYFSWDIMDGLTFKSNFGIDMNFVKIGEFSSALSLARIALNKSLSEVTNSTTRSFTWDNTLTYQKTFGVHSIQALVGSSTDSYKYEMYTMKGEDQISPATEYYYWGGFPTTTSNSSYSTTQMVSFFGRLNYKLNDKYLFQATYRTDGSSVLAENNRWYGFPSASVGWRISEEDFMKGERWISNLKARFSWGKSGNAAISPYNSLTLIGNTPIYYTFGNEIRSSLAPGQTGNPNLKWETTSTYDFGLDFSFLRNRISGTIDVYKSITSDLLFEVPLPTTSVYPTMTANVAGSENIGIEIALNTVNYKSRNFEWTTDWLFAKNKDKVTKLREGVDELVHDTYQIWRVGSPVRSYYYYDNVGVFSIEDMENELAYISQQNSSAAEIDRGQIPMVSNGFFPGDIKLKDVNNDGLYNDEDKVLFNQSPLFTFSINNSFSVNTSIGSIGLSTQIISRQGQNISYGFYQSYKPGNQTVENGPFVNAWTPTNTGGDFPRYSTTGNSNISMYWYALNYIDGSFFKIKDITLSYSFLKTVTDKLHLSNVKLYATAKNYFVFSKVKNFDPEAGGSMAFPLAKQIIFGVNLNF